MTRDDLAERLQECCPEITSKAAAKRVVAALFEQLAEVLEKNDDEVAIHGFGKFVIEKKPARKGRNPATGDTITVPKKRAVKFKPAKQLKDRINY